MTTDYRVSDKELKSWAEKAREGLLGKMRDVILPQKLDLHSQWTACAKVAEEWAAEMHYIPQHLAIEISQMLDAVGMGAAGKPNTLWAKTREACTTIEVYREVADRLEERLYDASLAIQHIGGSSCNQEACPRCRADRALEDIAATRNLTHIASRE